MISRRSIAIAVVLAIVLLLFSSYAAAGQSDWVTVANQNVQVNFPDDVVFTVEFTSTHPVENVTLTFRVIDREASRQEPATTELLGETITAEFVLKTRGGSSLFLPPGADLTYFWTFEDTDGNTVKTEPETFTYLDTRFEWESVSDGLISAYYFGPTETRAQTILETSVETLSRMGALLETELTRPVKVMIYNNPVQMQEALPFVSQTTTSGLATLGQAYSTEGVLLLMGFRSDIRGTTSHEVTHLLIAQAAEGPGIRIPDWLSEGLAEYGNLEPGFSYDQALLFSIREGRLLPITHMTNRPGTPEDVLLFYGQSRNIVKFMIDRYGSHNMAELFRVLKDGPGDIDDTLLEVYGFDRVGLDNRWRESIGLPPLPESQVDESVDATPTPRPTRVPLGFSTPTPAIAPSPRASELKGDISGDSSVDLNDLDILRGAYGARVGDPTYRADADLSGDQVVNYIDLAILGAAYSGP